MLSDFKARVKNQVPLAILLLISLLPILLFQNCGSGFQSQSEESSTSQPFTIVPPSNQSATPTPTPTPTSTPTPILTPSPTATPSPTPTPAADACTVKSETGGPTPVSWASPIRMRVYQRQGSSAELPVSVAFDRASDCLQARVLNADQSALVSWTKVIGGKIRVPNGGWYFLQVRAISNNQAGPIGMLDYIGVGEVFITAGQSNSTFWGQSPQKTVTGRVVYFDGADWQICQDPLSKVDPSSSGGAPWCLLGDMMATAYNVPIAFAPTGWGGTSIVQWQKNATGSPGAAGALYARLIQTTQYFGAGGVRAVLWHQGESDVGAMDSGTYATNLLNVVQSTREAVNTPLSWFISRVTYPHNWSTSNLSNYLALSNNGDPVRIQEIEAARTQIRKGQEALIQQDANAVYFGPDTDTLGTEYRYDGVHFSNHGLNVEAQAWFNSIHQIISRP